MQQVVEEGEGYGGEGSSYVYDDMFPALPESAAPAAPATQSAWGQSNSRMRVGTSDITQVFHVPAEERRGDQNNSFGDKESVRTCQSIMKETGACIEMSTSKDQSLTFLVSGKQDAVLDARRRILNSFQTQASMTITVPKEHHRWILGKAGTRLKDLEKETATKINVPSIGDSSDKITIHGTKDSIDKAVHEIRLISDEQSKKALERFDVPKCYHPFLFGPFQETLNQMRAETGASINIPPPSVDKTELSISGEKDGVAAAKDKIMKIYKDMEARCATVSVEVAKPQHRFVVGPRGSGIQEILQKTGVSVEMPPSDSGPGQGTITLRGPQEKLGQALNMVYEKASSVQIETIDAPEWLHKHIIGRKGENIRKITGENPKAHVELADNKIKVEGPPEEVKQVKDQLEAVVKDLVANMTYALLTVDSKHSKHIIGKAGANINRIKEQTDAQIYISESDGHSNIRIEGNKQGVDQAKQELEDLINKLENEKEKDVIIEQRLYRKIIGQKGEKIKEIREKFNQVLITFPNQNEKRDVVKVRGPKEDVDKCHKYLLKLVKEINESSHTVEVPIFKQYHKLVIGKGGANIRKIREETHTQIDLPAEGDKSDNIIITGKKENVEEARERILKIQNEQANIVTEEVSIPPKYYNSIIGAGGKLVKHIMDECGGVQIKFPNTDSKSDKVIVRGPQDDVDRAKQQLLELASEREQSSFTAEVRAKPQHHKYLIGKSGATIRKLRETTGCRIIFPSADDEDQELITIVGKKEGVQKAKEELEATIKDIDNVVEDEMQVDPKYHRHFVSRRGEILHRISEDCGGVTISFPRPGVQSDRVVLKGAQECIQAAKLKIQEIVTDLESMVTIDCVIPQKYHRSVMGQRGVKVQDITYKYDVQIKFPERSNYQDEEEGDHPAENGDLVNGDVAPKLCDTIKITGKPENCEAAKQALLDNVPITVQMDVPYDYHRSIIGQKGQSIRDLSDRYDVHIEVPNSDDHLDYIKITGTNEAVENARAAVEDRIKEIDADKEDRQLRSFELEFEVDPEFHPKIIGKRGLVINKIRQDHNVQIAFPRRGDENEKIIKIIGYEDKAIAARDDILKIVNDLNALARVEVYLDARVHSRLIGTRGRSIRKIMDEFNVEIKFPRSSDPEPDLVVISGAEADCEEAKDHLLNLEEEYLQDVTETSYGRPEETNNFFGNNNSKAGGAKEGFVVKGGPWEQQAPDTTSTEDFPSFGGGTTHAPASASSWGPRR
ncbi:LOW QUALITY PROTEIN: vigilin [Macrosteles quadrilineatus]|uniref:LOW QUALITY PROTEIN: vigilin n=1 Tax=Macrosteles quadrilineatus TaxID=74068 RepID=UPI0023E1D0C4|nr:LOW QUALITY PROTEIN: vigilin [Macrosteles quadrilineatus]